MLATYSNLQNEMRSLLAKELEINGLNFESFSWLSSENILLELSEIISSKAHEGNVSSIGAMFVENASDLLSVDYILIPFEKIAIARKMANGLNCFLFYERNIFMGLVYLKKPLDNELMLIRAFPPSGGLFVLRNENGTIKFFQGNRIILLENRSWFTKPLIKESAWKVSKCLSEIDHVLLNRVLEFSFHLLSPIPQVGATLVLWLLPPPENTELAQSTGVDLRDFNISLMDEEKAGSICHLISQIDGATFLDLNGNLFQTGVHLKNSSKSRELIPELQGTRHTSAQRFSYDFAETLVIAISSDGPVTIFSDGVNITKLPIHSSHKKAHELKKKHAEKKETIHGSHREIDCQVCKKHLMIEIIQIKGMNKKIIVKCVVCNSFLISLTALSANCRPYKIID